MNPIVAITEITQSAPPEILPDFPLNPPETINPPAVSLPMVYVEAPERLAYRVLTRDTLDAQDMEADLNELGRAGWWLIQILPQENQVLLMLMRRESSKGGSYR